MHHVSESPFGDPYLKLQTSGPDYSQVQIPYVKEIYNPLFEYYNQTRKTEKFREFELKGKINGGELSVTLDTPSLNDAKKYTKLFQSIQPNESAPSLLTNCSCTFDTPQYKYRPADPREQKSYDNFIEFKSSYETPFKFPCEKAKKRLAEAQRLGIILKEFIINADLTNEGKKIGKIEFKSTASRKLPNEGIENIDWFTKLSFASEK